MWELDEGEFDDIKLLASTRRPSPRNGLLPESVVDSLVDPDDISAKIRPSKVAKQQQELRKLQPLQRMFSSHLEPFTQFARYLVWNVLNSGPVNSRQARKLTQTIYGWDETLFLKVFDCFGAPGPVTIRRNAPLFPPVQPPSYEGAWAAGRESDGSCKSFVPQVKFLTFGAHLSSLMQVLLVILVGLVTKRSR